MPKESGSLLKKRSFLGDQWRSALTAYARSWNRNSAFEELEVRFSEPLAFCIPSPCLSGSNIGSNRNVKV
jgi:hypothetical protein